MELGTYSDFSLNGIKWAGCESGAREPKERADCAELDHIGGWFSSFSVLNLYISSAKLLSNLSVCSNSFSAYFQPSSPNRGRSSPRHSHLQDTKVHSAQRVSSQRIDDKRIYTPILLKQFQTPQRKLQRRRPQATLRHCCISPQIDQIKRRKRAFSCMDRETTFSFQARLALVPGPTYRAVTRLYAVNLHCELPS